MAELRALVAAHPFRERLRAALMVALYRADRQAEALEVYTEARRLLVDELGIEPGQELQRLHRAILAEDHTLAAPVSVPTSVIRPPAPASPLLGRDRELNELCTLLRIPEVRLITVVGIGGVGKTRLAVEVAHRLDLEHLLPAAPLVADLLAAAPPLAVLATSRVALRLAGEHRYPLGPLPLPDPTRAADLEHVRTAPAAAPCFWTAPAPSAPGCR